MALVKYNNNSLSAVTAASSLPTGAMTLIKSQTASSSSTISFVHGTSDVVLDSTYPIYMFKYINCHAETNNVAFSVNFRDGSSAYDATKTTTIFAAAHYEDDSEAELTGYTSGDDIAQGTGFQDLTRGTKNDNDACCSGQLWLFNPSSTTFVKHFISVSNDYNSNDQTNQFFVSGYCNVTAAIDAVQFKFSSGDIDSGTIKLYGIKDS